MPNGGGPHGSCDDALRQCGERIAKLECELKEAHDFMAASSLCEGCQKKREERAIIATPRIQVEEERDRLAHAAANALRFSDDPQVRRILKEGLRR